MKRFTLLIGLIIFANGAYAQSFDTCSKEVLEGGDNAWGQLHDFIFASDFIVEQNNTFVLSSLSFNAITTPNVPVEGITISFYEDTGQGPGAELGTQEISEFEMTPIGVYASLDKSTISLDLNNSVVFEGNANGTTTYWVGVIIDYSDEDMSFIEVTTEFDTDNATYFYDNESQMWIDGASPFWPLGGFEHAMISLYGDCNALGVTDFIMTPFTYFTQYDQLFIESSGQIQDVTIYNLLGQRVISENVHATSGNINLQKLNAGVYLTKVTIGGKSETFRIVVK